MSKKNKDKEIKVKSKCCKKYKKDSCSNCKRCPKL